MCLSTVSLSWSGVQKLHNVIQYGLSNNSCVMTGPGPSQAEHLSKADLFIHCLWVLQLKYNWAWILITYQAGHSPGSPRLSGLRISWSLLPLPAVPMPQSSTHPSSFPQPKQIIVLGGSTSDWCERLLDYAVNFPFVWKSYKFNADLLRLTWKRNQITNIFTTT